MTNALLKNARWLFRRSVGFAHVFDRRRREYGWNSAWVFAKGVGTTRWLRMRNRLPPIRVECPCCNWKGYEFLPLDVITFLGPANICPRCDSQVRHRALIRYLSTHEPRLREGTARVLHFAPEAVIGTFFTANPQLRYMVTDLGPHFLEGFDKPRFQGDITRLPIADNAFDYVFCSHVLEHLKDDRQGIAEIRRVLKPGGTAYLMVPFNLELDRSAFYDPPRADVFGHYWWYSVADFKDKLEGFEVEEIRPEDFLTAEERDRFRIYDREIIHRCRKPAAPGTPSAE